MNFCYMIELRPSHGNWYGAKVFEDKEAAEAEVAEWNKDNASPQACIVRYQFITKKESDADSP